MKPVQIGLLVLVGALGGAVIEMLVIQKSKPAPQAVAQAPVTAPVPPAAPVAPPVPDVQPAPPAQVVRHEKPPVKPPARPAVEPRAEPVTTASDPPAEPSPLREPQAIAGPPPSAPPPVNPEPAQPPAAAEEPAPEPVETAPQQPAPSVTLKTGLVLPVRLGEALSSDHNMAGDTFTATLDAPLSADGFVIAERGARVEGRVVEAGKSSHALALELTRLNTSDGQHVDIQTETYRKLPPKATSQDVGIVAAAAGVGAVIGAMAGGGKGAAIGASGAGGAAGAGGVVATHSRSVSMPTETKVSFRLKQPVTITEKLNH